MIKMNVAEKKDGITAAFTIEADEPITVSQVISESNHAVVYVYRGVSVSEHDEPIGAFDSACNSKSWTIE